tara:strand:- start:55 stop:588 length:534 start_codon:yes stop_codon:yes gene_type:complete
MNESSQTLKSTTIQYGMYFGFIIVAYNFIAHIMGISNEFSWTAIGVYYAVFFSSILVIIPLSLFNFRKLNDNFLSLTEAMKLGLGILLIGLIINISSQLIIWEFLTDQNQMISSIENFMIENVPPEMLTDEMIVQATEDTRNQFSFASIGTRLLSNLILISLYTLIMGLAFKRTKSA